MQGKAQQISVVIKASGSLKIMLLLVTIIIISVLTTERMIV